MIVALLVLAGVAFALLSNDGNGGKAGSNSTPTPQAKKKETATPTATAEKTAEPTATASPTATATEEADEPSGSKPDRGEPAGSNPTELQLQAFNLNKAGKPEEALPVAQKAVRRGCKGNASVLSLIHI